MEFLKKLQKTLEFIFLDHQQTAGEQIVRPACWTGNTRNPCRKKQQGQFQKIIAAAANNNNKAGPRPSAAPLILFPKR